MENIPLFIRWAAEYSSQSEFASMCDQFISDLAAVRNKVEAEMPKEKTKVANMRDHFELRVDRFCFVIKKLHNGKSTNKVKCAMMHVYDSDKSGTWFAPRNCREYFNEQKFCRVIHFLHYNKFLEGVKWHNKELSVLAIANVLVGNIFEDAADNDGCDYAVFEDNSLKISTLRTYLSRDSLCKGFEQACTDLQPDNFDD